ncbi:MAG TPA: hypothetical protein VNT79_10170 [Phycisphaerae bacterium]|nr:hypothetical protein [Phycisphaerae bacterium]
MLLSVIISGCQFPSNRLVLLEDSIAPFVRDFNAHSKQVRYVALFSPT